MKKKREREEEEKKEIGCVLRFKRARDKKRILMVG